VKFNGVLCGTQYSFNATATNAAGLDSTPSDFYCNPYDLPSCPTCKDVGQPCTRNSECCGQGTNACVFGNCGTCNADELPCCDTELSRRPDRSGRCSRAGGGPPPCRAQEQCTGCTRQAQGRMRCSHPIKNKPVTHVLYVFHSIHQSIPLLLAWLARDCLAADSPSMDTS
jgi:hypothetical protein